MKTCNFHYISLSLQFKELCTFLQKNYKTNHYRDVVHIDFLDTDIFVFEYGSIVFWNTSYDGQREILDKIKPFCTEVLEGSFEESLEYIEVNDQTGAKIVNEMLFLQSENSYFEKLACSYAFAQSINLDYFENSLENLIKKIRYIPKALQSQGKISMPKDQVSRLIGEILFEKHSINLHFNLLEKPDFFWDYEEFEKSYISVARYQEINSRVDIINKKITVLEDTVDILVEEQRHNHNAFLEWIVIILIVFEIILSLLGIFGIVKH
jgi:uncharacterized Rmd1/YagE family protein